MDENRIAKLVVNAAIEVHRNLGPGLLESVYQRCMFHELTLSGLRVERETLLKGFYKGLELDINYRMDMVIEGKVVLELKAVEKLLPVHHAQLLSYLKLSNTKRGMLVNFNEVLVKDGIKRVVNNL